MEIKSLPVFTTRSVFNKEKPLNFIVHDMDGDWQFLNIDEISDTSNGVVISMEEAIVIEESLLEIISYMGIGTFARLNEYKEWNRSPMILLSNFSFLTT